MRAKALLPLVLTVAALGAAPAVARADGTISGTVVNTNGAVIPNVCVDVIGRNARFTAITNIYGAWSQTVATGRWRVKFDSCGLNYLSQWWPGRSVFGREGRPIAVLNGRVVSGIDADLAPGGQISGQLVNGVTGVPFTAASTHVRVDRPGHTDAAYQFFFGGDGGAPFAPVEPLGQFLISALPSGTYIVSDGGLLGRGPSFARTWYPEDTRTPGRAQRVQVIAGEVTTIGVLRAQAGETITGTVRGPGDQALPGVAVRATITEPDGSLYTPARARTFGSKGRYVLRGLPAGRLSVRIDVRGDAPVQVRRAITAGQTQTLDVRLRRRR